MIEPEQIVEMVASGRKVAEVAAECGTTDAAVSAILDQGAKRLFGADKMLKDIMLEGARLAAICKKFFRVAMADRGHDARQERAARPRDHDCAPGRASAEADLDAGTLASISTSFGVRCLRGFFVCGEETVTFTEVGAAPWRRWEGINFSFWDSVTGSILYEMQQWFGSVQASTWPNALNLRSRPTARARHTAQRGIATT